VKIGIISDTHDGINKIKHSVKLFKDRNVQFAIHCGDYVNPSAVKAFKGIKLIGILGNNDIDVAGLSYAFKEIGGEIKGDFFEFQQDGLRIAVYHGTQHQRKVSLINSESYDVFFCGHTHKMENRQIGKTRVINPGTAKGWFVGYRSTIAIFNSLTKDIEFLYI
jgi:putative phosphoesterase